MKNVYYRHAALSNLALLVSLLFVALTIILFGAGNTESEADCPALETDKALNVVPYEIQEDHRNLPEVLSSQNPAIKTKRQLDLPMSGMRKQQIISVKAKDRPLVKNQTEPEASSKSSFKRSGDEGQDSETKTMPSVRERTSIYSYSRTSSGLQQEIRSGLAMSSVPPRRTFERRDLVLAEPIQTETQVAPIKLVGEARESTNQQPNTVSTSETKQDSRGGVQYSLISAIVPSTLR